MSPLVAILPTIAPIKVPAARPIPAIVKKVLFLVFVKPSIEPLAFSTTAGKSAFAGKRTGPGDKAGTPAAARPGGSGYPIPGPRFLRR